MVGGKIKEKIFFHAYLDHPKTDMGGGIYTNIPPPRRYAPGGPLPIMKNIKATP